MRTFAATCAAAALLSLGLTMPAFAAESNTEPDTAKQFAELKRKGVFDGYADGSAGLDKEMTRSEFAAVLVRLLKLDKQSGKASYEDTASHWAHEQGYIEAVTKARLMEGTAEHTFDPDGKVTLEQLAAVMTRALKLEPPAAGPETGLVSDWAKGYTAAALKAGLLATAPDYRIAAKRSALVAAAYSADRQLAVKPEGGKMSIKETAAAGAKTLRVKLNNPADTAKAVIAVSRSGTELKGTVKWSDDKMSADITFASALQAGAYTVELKGLDPKDVGQSKADLTVEKERIVKLDFVTASDVIAQADDIEVEFKATNQYGERSELTANRFTISSGSVSYTTVAGKQAVKLDVRNEKKDSKFAVTIIDEESQATASKLFTVGEAPRVSKLELGKIVYAGDDTSLLSGKSAYLKVAAFDQYGMPVTEDSASGDSGYGLNTNQGVRAVVTDSSAVTMEANPWFDQDNDGIPELKLTAGTNTSGTKNVTLTLFALGSGQSVTAEIPIAGTEVPDSVEFDPFNRVVASGDTNIPLPITVKDAKGNKLTTDQIVDYASESNGFNVFDTLGNIGGARLETSGKYRGMVVIPGPVSGKSNGYIQVTIPKTGKSAKLSVSTQEERYPATILVKNDLSPKYLNGAEGKIKIQFKDQFGELIKQPDDRYIAALADGSDPGKVKMDAAYKLFASFENAGDVTGNGALYPLSGGLKDAFAAYAAGHPTAPSAKEKLVIDEAFYDSAKNNAQGITLSNVYDTDLKFKAADSIQGTYRLSLRLVKLIKENGIVKHQVMNEIVRTTEVIDGSGPGTKFNYTIYLDKGLNNTIYSVVDAYRDGAIPETTVTPTPEGIVKDRRLIAKEVKISAKDSGGAVVEVPASYVNSLAGRISSSNPTVVSAVYYNTGTSSAPVYKYYLVGGEAGQANVSVVYDTPDGAKSHQLAVTVKSDYPSAASMKADKTLVELAYSELNGKNAWDAKLMKKITLKDQYGSEYTQGTDLLKYNALFGIRFYVQNVQYKNGAGDDVVSVDPETGKLSYSGDGDMAAFTLVAIAPSGKSAVTVVNLK